MAKFFFVKVQAQPKVQAPFEVGLGRFDCAAQLKVAKTFEQSCETFAKAFKRSYPKSSPNRQGRTARRPSDQAGKTKKTKKKFHSERFGWV